MRVLTFNRCGKVGQALGLPSRWECRLGGLING
jgi:hypothetical protein